MQAWRESVVGISDSAPHPDRKRTAKSAASRMTEFCVCVTRGRHQIQPTISRSVFSLTKSKILNERKTRIRNIKWAGKIFESYPKLKIFTASNTPKKPPKASRREVHVANFHKKSYTVITSTAMYPPLHTKKSSPIESKHQRLTTTQLIFPFFQE